MKNMLPVKLKVRLLEDFIFYTKEEIVLHKNDVFDVEKLDSNGIPIICIDGMYILLNDLGHAIFTEECLSEILVDLVDINGQINELIKNTLKQTDYDKCKLERKLDLLINRLTMIKSML